MKKIILSVATILLLSACGGGDSTTYESGYIEDNYDDNNTLQEGMVIDDVNVSDITSINNVDNITVTDNGMFILCTEGSTCSVTTADGDESSDTTTDNNSSS